MFVPERRQAAQGGRDFHAEQKAGGEQGKVSV